MENQITPEDVDRVLSRRVLQTDSAHTALWLATAAALIHRGLCDPEDLLAGISYMTTRAPAEQRGGIFDSITRGAMRAMANLKYPGAEQPEWVKGAISGEQPITSFRRDQKEGSR